MAPVTDTQRQRDAARELLDTDFLRKIEQLHLTARKVLAGRMRGERRSKKRGVSIEFADYRNYVRGDDTRFIDWNIYSRLDRLFLKLFHEEQELTLYLLIDTSKSMGFGDPQKLLFAKRVAAALGYIGLVANDKVGVTAFRDDRLVNFTPTRGRARTWALLQFLSELGCDGRTDLGHACKHFALQQRLRGIVVLLSDLLDPRGFEDALKWFLHRNHEVYVVQLLSKEELEPTLTGHLELVDAETGDRTDVTISRPLLRRYRSMVDSHCTAVRDWCTGHGMIHMVASTATEFDQLILNYLRRRGLLR